jgi:DNA-binding LytR/AlgR family response regulator
MKFEIQTNVKTSVKQRNTIISVFIENISYINCVAELSTIHFRDNRQPIVVSKLLKEFDIELEKFGFIRVRANFLVNYICIKKLENAEKKQLTLINDEIIPVSRRKYYRIRHIIDNLHDHLL